MDIYAETPAKRTSQIIGDVAFIAFAYVCYRIGRAVHDVIASLAEPARSLSGAAGSLKEQAVSLERALPSFLNLKTDRLEDAAGSLGASADRQIETVERVATTVGWVVAGMPILIVGLAYLTHRYLWWRRYNAAVKLRSSTQFEKLMALRALVTAPVVDLRKVSQDPVGDYEAGRFTALAALQSRSLGLLPTAQDSRPPS